MTRQEEVGPPTFAPSANDLPTRVVAPPFLAGEAVSDLETPVAVDNELLIVQALSGG